jgi:hypothetical protein
MKMDRQRVHELAPLNLPSQRPPSNIPIHRQYPQTTPPNIPPQQYPQTPPPNIPPQQYPQTPPPNIPPHPQYPQTATALPGPQLAAGPSRPERAGGPSISHIPWASQRPQYQQQLRDGLLGQFAGQHLPKSGAGAQELAQAAIHRERDLRPIVDSLFKRVESLERERSKETKPEIQEVLSRLSSLEQATYGIQSTLYNLQDAIQGLRGTIQKIEAKLFGWTSGPFVSEQPVESKRKRGRVDEADCGEALETDSLPSTDPATAAPVA